jgi:hypothetical protein
MIEYIKPWLELIVTTLTTLVAAYGGTKYAFSIQNKKNTQNQDDLNIANGNLALFTLIRFHNKFLNINSQMIGDMRNHPHRHHFIKPSAIGAASPPKFDYASLAFLINTDPNLLGKLSSLEQDVTGTIEIIDLRSRLHFEQLQPLVERLGRELGPDPGITPEQVENILGERTTFHLVRYTDFMVGGVDRAIARTKELSIELGLALKRKYPDAMIIKIA